jgi:hypothetical protein
MPKKMKKLKKNTRQSRLRALKANFDFMQLKWYCI